MGNAASQQTLAGWDVEDVANLFEDDEEIGWFAPIVVENEIDGEKLLTMSEARLSELGKKPDGGSVDSTWLRSAVTFRVISALRDDLSIDGKGDNDSHATGESADTAAKAAKAAADAQAVAEMAAAVMAGDGERDAPSAAQPKSEKPPLPGNWGSWMIGARARAAAAVCRRAAARMRASLWTRKQPELVPLVRFPHCARGGRARAVGDGRRAHEGVDGAALGRRAARRMGRRLRRASREQRGCRGRAADAPRRDDLRQDSGSTSRDVERAVENLRAWRDRGPRARAEWEDNAADAPADDAPATVAKAKQADGDAAEGAVDPAVAAPRRPSSRWRSRSSTRCSTSKRAGAATTSCDGTATGAGTTPGHHQRHDSSRSSVSRRPRRLIASPSRARSCLSCRAREHAPFGAAGPGARVALTRDDATAAAAATVEALDESAGTYRVRLDNSDGETRIVDPRAAHARTVQRLAYEPGERLAVLLPGGALDDAAVVRAAGRRRAPRCACRRSRRAHAPRRRSSST